MTALEYLETHLPKDKAKKMLAYLDVHSCALRITRPRKTKRGDFRQNGPHLSISVNHDTNSFRFLFTFVHEIAHLKTFLQYKNKVQPHGSEWKINFRELFAFFGVDEEFEKEPQIYAVAQKELLNPKACSGVNIDVERAFSLYDEQVGVHLEEVPLGDLFIFKSHKYQKLEDRRSRVLCLNLANNRKYTINKAVVVELIS